MARQILDIGSNANDGSGDTLRAAMQKVNENFAELYNVSVDNAIEISGNNITATRSNDDINLIPAGTGVVTMNSITIDNNINITDNIIKTTKSSSNLKLLGSGISGVRIDKMKFIDNQILTDNNNNDLELSANGTGTVKLNSLNFPTTDGSANQVLKTDGAGNLGWVSAFTGSFTHVTNTDGTATITGSSIADIDTFDATAYRSAKYSVSIWDSTNSRSGIYDFFVTHNGTAAYMSTMGLASAGTGTDMATFSADISGGNVRVRAVLVSGDGTTFKFSKILFLV